MCSRGSIHYNKLRESLCIIASILLKDQGQEIQGKLRTCYRLKELRRHDTLMPGSGSSGGGGFKRILSEQWMVFEYRLKRDR